MKAILLPKAILKTLLNDVNVKKYVNKSIYPLVAPETTKFPFIVLGKDSLSPSDSKDGYYEDTEDIIIYICSTDYFQSLEIALVVRECLDRKSGNVDGIQITEIRMLNANESFSENTYIQQLQFRIKIQND